MMGPRKVKADQVEKEAKARPPRRTTLGLVREWSDALVIAFLLAMFIRTFVVELFKIPSGSMTPTLVGTASDQYVFECDVSQPPDGEKDLVLCNPGSFRQRYHVFYRKNGQYVGNEVRDDLRVPLDVRHRGRNDRILVNKFIYWVRPPRRGEIVVFRVPPCIYQRHKPIYIKRVVGLPGDDVEIRQPHIYIDGRLLDSPDVFLRNEYVERVSQGRGHQPDYIEYTFENGWVHFKRAKVPPRHYLVLGDNSKSSLDSRDWGAVPESNLKGKAVLRYWPLDTIGFLD